MNDETLLKSLGIPSREIHTPNDIYSQLGFKAAKEFRQYLREDWSDHFMHVHCARWQLTDADVANIIKARPTPKTESLMRQHD